MKNLMNALIFVLAFVGQNAFGEQTFEGKINHMMRNFKASRNNTARLENDEIVNACLYTVYVEWENAYFALLKTTPLNLDRMSTLNEYSQFRASIQRDIHLLNATFPNLFAAIRMTIDQNRADEAWTRGPGVLKLEEPELTVMGDNFTKCKTSGINTALADVIAHEDINASLQAAEEIASGAIKVTFVKDGQGIALVVDDGKQGRSGLFSDIAGIEVSTGTDRYLTNKPK